MSGPATRPRVAVIGGGVAGVVAAHLLQQKHAVTLIERNDYVGGHTNTAVIPSGPDEGLPVDTGFIVFNERTYPHFCRFIRQLGVAAQPSEMSFAFSCRGSGLEYAGSSLSTLFAQPSNLLNPRFLAMCRDILRFNRDGLDAFDRPETEALTIAQFLDRTRASAAFREYYLVPMAAAIWSAPPGKILDYPAAPLLKFFHNHGLLTVSGHHQWLTIAGGSSTYVEKFRQRFTGQILTNSPVWTVARLEGGVEVVLDDRSALLFDQVVIAAHADQALRMLGNPTADERRLLGAWNYHANRAVLHTDARLMPQRRSVWSSWNYIRPEGAPADAATLTYWMNRLQSLRAKQNYCVTLNPAGDSPNGRTIASYDYEHPGYTFESVASQAALPSLNGVDRLWYCGSYFGNGFHEDAVRSAVRVGEALGCPL